MRQSIVSGIRKALKLEMFDNMRSISSSKLLLCFLGKSDNNERFFTKERVDKIRLDTGMQTCDTYEILGDAVYDVLFYSYVWRRRIPLDLYLLGRSKSNISMSCIVKHSDIYKYLNILREGRDAKTAADTFEALLGVVFEHMIEERGEVSETVEAWMTEVFDIGGVFDRLVTDRITPNGAYIRSSNEVKIIPLYKLAIQKLVITYFLFNKYKYEQNAPYIIHNIYHPYRDEPLISLEKDISRIMNSDDVLRDAAILSQGMSMKLGT